MRLDPKRKYVQVVALEDANGVAKTLDRLARHDAELVEIICRGYDHNQNVSYLIVATVGADVDINA